MAEGIHPLNADLPQAEQILAIIDRFSVDDWTTALPQPAGDGAYTRIAEALKHLARTVVARRTAADQQFEAILDVMIGMLALDFSQRAPMRGDDSTLDALAFGLNNIIDELSVSMVSRAYVDNIIASLPDPLFVVQADTTIQTANHAATQLFGYTEPEWVGLPLGRIIEEAAIVTQVVQVAEHGQPVSELATDGLTCAGLTLPVMVSASPLLSSDDPRAVCVIRDITERRRAEETLRQNVVQAETIRAQAAAIAELSTPLIPITKDIVVMPLIGTIDARRAQQMIDTLLHGITALRVRVAILDITGVAVVDTQVAQAVISAAQMAKLLGAQIMLTGIRPEVAQTLVSLDADLRVLTTHSTLQSGIAFVTAKWGQGGR